MSEESNRKKGKNGEKLIKVCLEQLDVKYKVLNDVYVSDYVKYAQIDHIVICEKVLFHIETKALYGLFHIPEYGKWRNKIYNEDTDVDPIKQAERHEKMLNRVLVTMKGYENIRMQGIVVLADIDSDADKKEKNGIPIIKPEELVNYIKTKTASLQNMDSIKDTDTLYKELIIHSSKYRIPYHLDNAKKFFIKVGSILFGLLKTTGRLCLEFLRRLLSPKVIIPLSIIPALLIFAYWNLYMFKVSDNSFLYVKESSGKILYNRAYKSADQITFGNVKYSKGISAVVQNNSTSSMTLRLNVKGIDLQRRVFEGMVCVDNDCVWDYQSKAKLQVLNGDEVLYDSGPIAPWETPVPVKVEVGGMDEIKLVFYYDNPTPSQICAAVVNPMLR